MTPGAAAAAEAFTERRMALGLTQSDIIRRVPISLRAVSYFECRARWPKPATRALLEQAVEWPPGHLTRLAEDAA